MGNFRLIAEARLQRENGTVLKDHGCRVRVALVYPNLYSIAMSNLGYQKVYSLLNARDNVVCERAFMPESKELLSMENSGNVLSSLESNTPLNRFDMVCFSITFEMDYINVLRILKLSNIPFRSQNRDKLLVAVGGLAPTLNPAVMSPFADLVFIGEAEEIINPFIDAYINEETSLKRFARVPGCLVPSLQEKNTNNDVQVKRAWSSDDSPNHTTIHTTETVFGDMWLVETGKGCGRHCRFCAAGYSYRPTRHYSLKSILSAIDKGLAVNGKIGLVGSAISDHPDALKIFRYIISCNGQFSISSLRIDSLSEEWLSLISKGGSNAITVAPEAGSETLRKKINKEITDSAIINAIAKMSKAGPFNIKLYFLVGLPSEIDKDVEAIVALIKASQKVMVDSSRTRGTLGSIEVSVNCFVPKPNTPFEREPFENIKILKNRLKIVKNGLSKVPNVSLSTSSPRLDYIQALLSLGNEQIGSFIEKAVELNGDLIEALKYFRLSGVNPDLIVYRRKENNEVLPWAKVGHGMRDDYLTREVERSEQAKTISECPPPDVECLRCGVYLGVCVNEKS